MDFRRRFPSPRLTAALVALAVLLWGAATPREAAQAQSVRQDAFTVSGIAVDVTATDTNVARDRAVAQAQRKGWDELFKQLLPPGSKAPAISDLDLSRAVQNFSVDDERLSPGRYVAVMTVRFAPEPVRQAMAGSGAAAYVEPSTRPMVLLPLTLRPDGTAVLWDDRTPWRAAWEAREAKPGALTPLTVPDGELSDIAAIGAQEALAGDAKAFAKIAGQHGAGGVVVAKTVLAPEGPALAQGMKVDVTLATLDGQNATKTVTVRADADDRPEDLLARAVTFAAAAVDELWRQERTVSAGPQQSLTALVPLAGLNEWIAARQKLAQIGGGARVDMLSLSRAGATVSVGYRGDVAELQARVSKQGMMLSQDGGGWTLTMPVQAPAQAPAAPSPADLPPVRP